MANGPSIIVIGGGIAGYPAAIRAARLGAQVTLVEKAALGGTCLNQGCIPTKALLQSAQAARGVQEAGLFGIRTGPARVDFPAVMKRKEQVVAKLRRGVAGLLRAKKIQVVEGEARVLEPGKVRVGKKTLSAEALIIASGSVPARAPIPGLPKVAAWDSDDFLAMEKLPAKAAIIGGGFIGVEFAQILRGLGSQVTVLEMLDQIAPGLDQEIIAALAAALGKQGIDLLTNAKVSGVSRAGKGASLKYRIGKQEETLRVDRVIVAVGRRPFVDGLGAERLGLALAGAAIKVNRRLQTNLPGVFAAGDVTGGIMLAHLAAAQGECAAINALGGNQEMDYAAVPSCIYTTPEVAAVGLSEEAAREKHQVMVGRFPFAGCGKAAVLGHSDGMVKLVADKKHGLLLGAHIIGPHATDLIAELVLALRLECTVEEVASAIHPHPTLSEAVMEASMSLAGGALHIP